MNRSLIAEGRCCRVYEYGDQIFRVPFQGEELVSGFLAALQLSRVGGPKVFQSDAATGSLLMERLVPGDKLSDSGLSFEQMRPIFCELFQSMRSLPTKAMLPIEDYFERRSDRLWRLVATTSVAQFLHGDLHHENILRHSDAWRPIDPKGLVGDPHFEVIAWLRNPIELLRDVPDLVGHLKAEILALSQTLDFDPLRIVQWGIVDSEGYSDPEHPWARLPRAYEELELNLGAS